jgi:hypothetical protein
MEQIMLSIIKKPLVVIDDFLLYLWDHTIKHMFAVGIPS